MNSTKSLFFLVFMLAGSAVQAKAPVIQSDIFYEISNGNTKAVKAWLKSKPDLSVKNAQGQSLLHVAALSGNFKLVKSLLKDGVQVNALDVQGKTALDYAVENKCNKIIKKLVFSGAKATSDQRTKYAQKIIHSRKVFKIFGIITGVIIASPFLLLIAAIAGVPGVLLL